MAGLESYCRISCGATGNENNEPFLLSLRGDDAINTLHSYGIHKVPHLGKQYVISSHCVCISVFFSVDRRLWFKLCFIPSTGFAVPPTNAQVINNL